MTQARRSNVARLLVMCMALAATATAWPHGDKAHAPARAAVAPEQKPWGIAGATRKATRTVVLKMTDRMRFEPDHLDVREGEMVRIVVRNTGRMQHELVIGTPEELDTHAELMKRFPDMEHDEPWMVHVAPGREGVIVWTFNRPGTFAFACLIAGHYQAGMVGRIDVHARADPPRH